MPSVIIAAIIGGSLYLSAQGMFWATNVIFCILILNVLLILYSVSVTTGLQRTLLMNAEKRIQELDESLGKMNMPAIFLIRVFLLLCVWHLYTLGYIFFAGVAATTVTMSLLIMVFRSLDSSERIEKE
jgi:hypothetical protein